MDKVLSTGEANKWTASQFKEALNEIMTKERAVLRSGERELHGREDLKRPWSVKQK